MKSFNCPICKKEITINEELLEHLINESKTIDNMPLFLKQGISIRQTCKNCRSKLEFHWGRQTFTTINPLKEFLFFNGRANPLTSKQTNIIYLYVLFLHYCLLGF